ncbi:MAG TPA: hypothetical protein DDW98_09040 [Gammaproteobacteria bacterium]|nr:hypothetical protein [Gammaproteobacteria bacterium]
MSDEQARRQERPVEATVVAKKVSFLESDLPKLVCSGPLSLRTTYTLRVDGPWGETEARNLRKILDLHIKCLSENHNKN